jgi:transcriptional regulator with XRE-family HTH domain
MSTTEEIGMTIGQLMQAQRKRLGLSMKKLAQELGVCEKTISNWEHDESCFPIDKLLPACRALRLMPSHLLGIESDLDAATKLEQVREVCRIIRRINERLRRTPDFDKARILVLERDGLRKQLAVLLDLPPADADLAGDLKRHQEWHAANKAETKPAVYRRYLDSFKSARRIYSFAPLLFYRERLRGGFWSRSRFTSLTTSKPIASATANKSTMSTRLWPASVFATHD